MLAESDKLPRGGGDTPKLRSACENCRQSKVKCNLSGKNTCIRCLRHGLPCRYRAANRSGKPKGSKNRATLKKLGQLPDEKPVLRLSEDRNRADTIVDRSFHSGYIDYGADRRPIETNQPRLLPESPQSHGTNIAITASPMSVVEYPPPFGDPLSTADPVYMQASMSPTFLQKEFITKGLTSCPLAVHIPGALQRKCECRDSLAFHLDQLRHMAADPVHLRLYQILQGVRSALSVCHGFMQCTSCHKDSTNLLLPVSTVDLSLQLFDSWISYELTLQHQSVNDESMDMNIGYGLYELCPEEKLHIRRFLIRGRLFQCKEVLAMLRKAIDISLGSYLGSGTDDTTSLGGNYLDQILRGYETTVEAFLQSMSESLCICLV